MMSKTAKINYLEFPAKDLAKTKDFFTAVFNWQFIDYGDAYCAFDKSAGLDGGFYHSKQKSRVETGSVLVVFYSEDLKETMTKVQQAGGEISQDIFDFPGGKRFHFLDPNGNEFAVWSE